MMDFQELLQLVVDKNASDLHLTVGSVPALRVNGQLERMTALPVLQQADMEQLLGQFLTPEQNKQYHLSKEQDISYRFSDLARFRINIYTQLGTTAFAMRMIPQKIKSIDELQLPQVLHQVTKLRQGLVLFTGPTGEGKSSSMAAIIEEINQTRSEHIITIEDPVEFVYLPAKSIISQREISQDTFGWDQALRAALREDPDVVLIGEMRDLETISAALTIAETGHLVLGTLHTNSASQTVDRIIDVFDEQQQLQVRQQLASTLVAVFSQRLIPTKKNSRVPAVEVMLGNTAIKNLIREGKSYQIDNVIQTSSEQGMISLESSLLNWVKAGMIEIETARQYSLRPGEIDRMMKG